jgi:hypothetical protein
VPRLGRQVIAGGNREVRGTVNFKTIVRDGVIGVVSGYVGTKVMEPVAMGLYKLEPEAARRREDAVRPGPPYEIAAGKTADLLGVHLDEERLEKAGMAFHYGLGMSWGPAYTFLRRSTRLSPVSAALLSGAAMSLLVDEGVTPLLGFSAPNRAYPLVTHLRGFLAHLAFGLGVAVTAEGLYRLVGEVRDRAEARHYPVQEPNRQREHQAPGVAEELPRVASVRE